jgi:hypothetical protein
VKIVVVKDHHITVRCEPYVQLEHITVAGTVSEGGDGVFWGVLTTPAVCDGADVKHRAVRTPAVQEVRELEQDGRHRDIEAGKNAPAAWIEKEADGHDHEMFLEAAVIMGAGKAVRQLLWRTV